MDSCLIGLYRRGMLEGKSLLAPLGTGPPGLGKEEVPLGWVRPQSTWLIQDTVMAVARCLKQVRLHRICW